MRKFVSCLLILLVAMFVAMSITACDDDLDDRYEVDDDRYEIDDD